MNQILNTPNKIIKFKWIFKIELIISLMIIFASLSYMIHLFYLEDRREQISDIIMQPYSVARLYSNITFAYDNEDTDSTPYAIGVLEIPSISLTIPVLSRMDDELLKLSACRFYGPMPNKIRKYLCCRTQL